MPTKPPDTGSTKKDIRELGIPLSRNVSVNTATLVTVILSLVAITWSLAQFLYINPADKNIDKLQQQLETKSLESEDLRNKYSKLQDVTSKQEHEIIELGKKNKVPALVYPVDNRAIIGQYVEFRWNYAEKLGYKNFLLEVRRAEVERKWQKLSRYYDPEEVWSKRYPIPQGHMRRSITFQFPEYTNGTYFWRIGTGELLYTYQQEIELGSNPSAGDDAHGGLSRNIQTETRLWSRYGSFSIYPSTWDKLIATQTLVVGTTAPYLSYDYPIGCGGRPNSYDMDLVDWLAGELESLLKAAVEAELRAEFEANILKYSPSYQETERKEFHHWLKNYLSAFKLKIETRIIDWEDIFASVTRGDVDMAIANITKTREREKKYPGLKFTTGYQKNEQVLITSAHYSPVDIKPGRLSKQELRRYLKGRKIATQQSSTNNLAARELRDVFNFEIDIRNYSSYVDVIEQVRNGNIAFGLIDRVRFDSVRYPDLVRLDIDLTPYLQDMYQRVFGTQHEEYAIAVSSHGGFNQFLFQLNRLLENERELEKMKTGKLYELARHYSGRKSMGQTRQPHQHCLDSPK